MTSGTRQVVLTTGLDTERSTAEIAVTTETKKHNAMENRTEGDSESQSLGNTL
jgi:hypothetical protein